VEPALRLAGTATRPFRRVGVIGLRKSSRSRLQGCCPIYVPPVATSQPPSPLEALASAVETHARDLALRVVDEGLRDDQLPSLQRLGQRGQLGDMPTFVAELGRELLQPQTERLRVGSALAAQAREHAREREAFGFAPREVVTEFLLLRRVLLRFVSDRATELGIDEVLLVERRLNDTIDRLVAECVVAYFDRATSELAREASHDQLTGLLHHQAFISELELELARARRYGHSLVLVFVDLNDFKLVNDTLGHPEGDRALQRFAAAFRGSLRSSDLAGRMGGDEFAAYLVEADDEAGPRLVARVKDRVDELIEFGELPAGCSFSAGWASFPDQGADVDTLFRLADARLYEAKRASAA
jgi:diguanylate cyclase (GGDEF)-like protein